LHLATGGEALNLRSKRRRKRDEEEEEKEEKGPLVLRQRLKEERGEDDSPE